MAAMVRRSLWAAVVACTFMLGRAEAAVLTPIPGSPFIFEGGGVNSNVALLSSDESRLYVSNQYSHTVTVLAVDPGGALTLIGVYPAGVGGPSGLALNPSNDRLYVTGSPLEPVTDQIAVLAINADDSLSVLQTLPSPGGPRLGNALEYVSLPGGDFLYVNGGGFSDNVVATYAVLSDGTLAHVASTFTGGPGALSGLYAPSRVLLARGGRLYAANHDSVAAFQIQDDGSLAAIAGSPFALPLGMPSSGALAVDRDGSLLFAGIGGNRADLAGVPAEVAGYAIGPDGGLGFQGTYTKATSEFNYPCTGLAVDDTRGLLFAAFGPDRVWSFEIGQFGPGTKEPSGGAGISLNQASTLLFAAGANDFGVRIGVYRFGAPEYALTISYVGAASGTVTAQANGVPVALSCTATGCTGAVPVDASVILTETPSAGAVFQGWGTVCTGTAATCAFTMNAAKTVQARFEPATHPLSVAIAGGSVGKVTSAPAGIDCGAGATACGASFAKGSAVVLTATFDPDVSAFKGWSVASCGTSATCSVTMDAAKAVTATFQPATYLLTVALAGTGSGSVSGNAISCSTGGPGPCSALQANGASVALTAAPIGASIFKGWSGCTSASGTTCNVTMSAAKRVTATFEPASYLLTVTRAGAGSGTVAGTANGVAFAWDACGATQCAKSVANGASVILTETPAAGSIFGGWGIVCTGTGATCSFKMNAAKTVKATFAAATYPLTVAVAGGGAGTLTSAPAGIACSAAASPCTASFANGTSVVLTVQFDPAQSAFKGWSASSCNDASTSCTVAMTDARSITATLEAATYPLAVTVGGAGSGTVTGPGLSCATGSATGCTAQEANGATVVLTAAVDPGSVFAGWSGCSSVSGNTCSVSMTGAQTVAATFEPATYPLRLDWSGTGAGTVSGVTWTSCDGTGCSATVANGAKLTLTAAAAGGSTFAGWGVVCTGTGTCSFTMNAAKRVVATFSAP